MTRTAWPSHVAVSSACVATSPRRRGRAQVLPLPEEDGRERAPTIRKYRIVQAEIALAAGFADQSHFSKIFKRRMGITPPRSASISAPSGNRP
jgi:AraC-like DNA-binding protein